MRYALVVSLAAFLVPTVTALAQADPRVGCYRANRPLGTSASAEGVVGPHGERIGEAGAALQTLAMFQLLADGRVDRPGTVLQQHWLRGSRWTGTSDTMSVRLSTGTSGWQLTLLPTHVASDTVYIGEARYLTDAVVKDWQPPRVRVSVRRELCARPAGLP